MSCSSPPNELIRSLKKLVTESARTSCDSTQAERLYSKQSYCVVVLYRLSWKGLGPQDKPQTSLSGARVRQALDSLTIYESSCSCQDHSNCNRRKQTVLIMLERHVALKGFHLFSKSPITTLADVSSSQIESTLAAVGSQHTFSSSAVQTITVAS